MKKVIATTMAAFLVAQVASAISAQVDYANAYVFRGVDSNYEGSAIQPGFEGEVLGVTVGTWASYDTGTESFTEIDLYAGYALPALVDGVDLGLAFCEYTYPGVSSTSESQTELGLVAETSVYGFAVGAGYYKEVDADLNEYAELSISGDYALTAEIAASYGVTIGYVDTEAGESGVSYTAYSFGAETALNEELTLSASITLLEDGDTGSNAVNGEDQILVVGVGGSF